MCRFILATFVAFLILCTTLYTEAKGRGGHHSSHGHSGGGHHYGGHSSSGGSHSYPASHGMSGNSHGGSSGHPSSGGSHSYPASHGLSGSSSSKNNYHYHYNPPRQITYTPVHGGAPMTYPVYFGHPPVYVYEYRDSGSVYSELLTGLALYNLGSHTGSVHHHTYTPQTGEQCRLGVKKSNGDYEETKIKCEIITSFIFEEEEKKRKNITSTSNTTVVTTTWSNVTTFDMINGQPNMSSTASSNNVTYTPAPNGTLIPQVTSQNLTNDHNGTITSMRDSVTVTTTNSTTTVTNAVDVKGKEIQVTPDMQCYIIRNTPTSHMKRSVPCEVLQSYAKQSLRRNSASRHVATIAIFAAVFTVCSNF